MAMQMDLCLYEFENAHQLLFFLLDKMLSPLLSNRLIVASRRLTAPCGWWKSPRVIGPRKVNHGSRISRPSNALRFPSPSSSYKTYPSSVQPTRDASAQGKSVYELQSGQTRARILSCMIKREIQKGGKAMNLAWLMNPRRQPI
jgi:hypothetical protein